MEVKDFNGKVTEVKQIERDGVKVGVISGYIATWDIDRGSWGVRDKFVKGCFLGSIAEFQTERRMVRFKDHHGRTVGGWLYDSLIEDEKGLYGVAEINLEVQQGLEAYKLAKQGVLVDFSIGFEDLESEEAENGTLRIITKAKIWEGSIVDEPMNPKANVTSVKGIDSDKLLTLTCRDIDLLLRKELNMSRTAAKKFVACLDFEKLRDAESSNQRDAEEKAFGNWKEVINELNKIGGQNG